MATTIQQITKSIYHSKIAAVVNSLLRNLGGLTDSGHTHTGTAGSLRGHERLVPPAPGTQIHASMAGGAALNVSTAFTRIMPASNIRLSRGAAGNATVYTVTGTRFGSAQTETINSNGASDVEGNKIFDTVTQITSDVDPGTTTTMKSGVIVGLDRVAVAIEFLAVGTSDANGVVETGTLNSAKDGFTPTTAPDGSKVFHIRYTHTPPTTASATTGISTTINATTKVHLSTSEKTVQSADASSLATSLTLVNELCSLWQKTSGGFPGHINDDLAHVAKDTTNTLDLGGALTYPALTLAQAIANANALYTAYNAHLSQSGVHQNNDGTNTASSSSATDQSSLNTRLNDLKSKFNSHLANATPAGALRLVDG